MKRKHATFAAVATLTALSCLVAASGRAFDHADAPSAAADPAVDIGDVYAFMKPEQAVDGGYSPSGRIVMAMTFSPNLASYDDAGYTSNLEYIFRVRRVSSASTLALGSAPNFKVTCSFVTPSRLLCNVNGFQKLVDVGQPNTDAGADPVQIFVGPRSDPAFADVQALRTTLSTGQLAFAANGVNAFQGRNVMALVVEADVRWLLGLDAGAALPLLAVGAETKRN